VLRLSGLGYVCALLIMSCAFQYQAKLLANEIAAVLSRNTSLMSAIEDFICASAIVRLVFVLLLAVALFVIWLLVLTKLDLSIALPLAAVALVVNALGTGLLLGEGIGALRVAGVVVVALGIFIVMKS
jgi:hypothetical protein